MDEYPLQPRIPLLGLTLGGGGARGFAHVGILKRLEADGIAPSFLAGSSMGGLIAALSAIGWTGAEIEAEVTNRMRLSKLIKLVDLSRPRRGLLEGQRVRSYLVDLIGEDRTFAGLRVPLALTAVDLRTGHEVVLREGSLVEAVLATICVPGLFPPVQIGEHRLVDGGLLNNVPVDVVRAMGAEVVLAIDVSPCFPFEGDDSPESEPFIPHVLPAFARDFYLAELIMTSALTEARLRSTPPDLIIRPALPPGIDIFWGFSRAKEAISAGFAAAEGSITALHKLLTSGST